MKLQVHKGSKLNPTQMKFVGTLKSQICKMVNHKQTSLQKSLRVPHLYTSEKLRQNWTTPGLFCWPQQQAHFSSNWAGLINAGVRYLFRPRPINSYAGLVYLIRGTEREKVRLWGGRKSMASIVRSVLKSIREKGLSNFIRELKEEGYT